MARMLPRLKDSEIDRRIDNAGERAVYRAFRDQLPDDWVVRHSYFSCHRFDAGQRLNPREVDFVILAPNQGILFVEVKGSMGYECRGARWYRIERDGREIELNRSPFEQVNGVHQHLIQVFCREQGLQPSDFPGIHGHLVIYPFARRSGALPPSQDPAIILTHRDMASLHTRLRDAFSDWGDSRRGARFHGAAFEKLHEAMKEECSFVTLDSTTASSDNAVIERLTKQQFDTFRGLLANSRALIDGRAGSGKTLLALWTANSIASRGGNPRVLFLCYSRLLPAWLRLKYPPVPGVDIESYHSLCKRYVIRAGLDFCPGSDIDDFFRQTAPELFEHAIDIIGNAGLYDAVLVDEAHDFAPSWWLSTEMLLRSERSSTFLVFHDPDQSGVFRKAPGGAEDGRGDARSTPDAWLPVRFDTTFTLDLNCRNTASIAKFAGSVLSRELHVRDDAPQGARPDIRPPHTDAEARAAEVETVVRHWIDQEGFRPSQIAVLSPYRRENTSHCLHGRSHLAGTRLLTGEDELEAWLNGTGILCTTTKSFKGLEAECAIVTDIPDIPATSMSIHEMYVGATRAKHHLCLVPANESAQRRLQKC
jgi:hypothetical protein